MKKIAQPDLPKGNETKNSENHNRTQHYNKNLVEMIKENHDWRERSITIMKEWRIKRVNELLKTILTDHIIELNDLYRSKDSQCHTLYPSKEPK